MSLMVDYITMPPKSQEIAQVQKGEQVKQDNMQQEFASQFQQQVQNGTHQTIRRAKAENQEFKYDEKDKNGKNKKKRKNSGNKETDSAEEEQKPERLQGMSGSRFDMKI